MNPPMPLAEGHTPPIDSEELRALLTLNLLPGLGDVRITSLMRRMGSARRALAAVLAGNRDAADAAGSADLQSRVDRMLGWIDERPDIELIGFGAETYPAALCALHDPPPLLFARGDVTLLDRTIVSIVGTRASTDYGNDATRMLAATLARADVVVMSGLAHGIDRVAHEAALEAGGLTAAVIGSGIDVCYPRRNAGLQDRIARDGLLLTEFLPGEPALPHHFPRRNRILAALARIVCVMEAPARSGALLTVDHALDLGKVVFALPGPVGRPANAGTNALLRDGAEVLVEPADVLSALENLPGTPAERQRAAEQAAGILERRRTRQTAEAQQAPAAPVPDPPDGPQRRVWTATGYDPTHVDELAATAGVTPATALAALLELEVAGYVRQQAGLLFRRS